MHLRDRHLSRSADWVRRVRRKQGDKSGMERQAYGRKCSLYITGTRGQARVSCRVLQWVVERRVSDEDDGWYHGVVDRCFA